MLPTLFAWMLVVQSAPDSSTALPSVDTVIEKMVQRDQERRTAFQGYTSVRRYMLENTKYHKQAYMLVKMIQRRDGSKDLEVVTSSGWNGARKHVFPRLLEAEAEASRLSNREDSRFTPKNYSFSMLRTEEADGRKAYVISVTPKKQTRYLMRGTIWVDVEDFAIMRMEGEPAKNPSFWIKSVQFAHKYEKHGSFWLAAADSSVSDARIFGPTELRIDYFDYVFNEPSREAKLR